MIVTTSGSRPEEAIFTLSDEFDRKATIEFIRSAEIDDLRNPTYIEHVVIPKIGLDPFIPDHYPEPLREFCGRNFMACQMPVQLAKYLSYLSTKKIDSYLEVGVAMGGTFVLTLEYLKRFNPTVDAMVIDMNPPGEHLKWYYDNGGEFRFLVANTAEPKAANAVMGRKWGLALIDGDHSEEGCWRDYLMVKEFARMIAFHDIVNDLTPGVVSVWGRLKAAFPASRYREFVEQYPEFTKFSSFSKTMGLGVVSLD